MGLTDYPYIFKLESLKAFLEKIPRTGVPDKVTLKYIKSIGFTSSSDRALLTVLKFIGFLDSQGTPTESYKAFRDSEKARAIMASQMKSAYSELFSRHPNACNADTESLRNFFAAETSLGERTVSGMVGTFKTLCELGDFEREVQAPLGKPPMAKETVGVKLEPRAIPGLTINLNIQIQLPLTENAKIYDALFESLKKHLLERGD